MLDTVSLEITIPTHSDRRLLVDCYEPDHGRRLVGVAPQYQDRSGAWRLSHSGLLLLPDVARELASALVTMAGEVEQALTDTGEEPETEQG